MQTQRSSVLQNYLYHGEMKTCFYVFPGVKKKPKNYGFYKIFPNPIYLSSSPEW